MMHRTMRFALLAGAPFALFVTAAPVSAQLNKCLVHGKVIYTDGNCPRGATQQSVRASVPRHTDAPVQPAMTAEDIPAFAVTLYEHSVYTAEEASFKALVAAEVDLVASRWLARKISVTPPGARSHLPARWEDMLGQMRKALAPVVETQLKERERATRITGLQGPAPYVRAYDQLMRAPKQRPNIQFADGTSANDPGSDQFTDIAEILVFHTTPAAIKWRRLWPDLRVYGAQMAALQYRVMADPSLGPASDWDSRARILMKRIGGRVLTPGEWERTANDRLGYTLSGLGRFLLPLGTEMRADAAAEESMKVAEQNRGVTITQFEGVRMTYRLLDGRWASDISKRLTRAELQQVDEALTASFVAAKGRWFAPLELDFDGYMAVANRLRSTPELRQVYQAFKLHSSEAMERTWALWLHP